MAENTEIAKLVRQLQSQFELQRRSARSARSDCGRLQDGSCRSGSIRPQTSFDYTAWTSAIGHFEDQVSDNANKIIVALQAQSAVH
jgi:hypothetical protein